MADNTKLYQALSGLYTGESKLFDRLSGHEDNNLDHISSSESSYTSGDVGRVVRKDGELYLIKKAGASEIYEGFSLSVTSSQMISSLYDIAYDQRYNETTNVELSNRFAEEVTSDAEDGNFLAELVNGEYEYIGSYTVDGDETEYPVFKKTEAYLIDDSIPYYAFFGVSRIPSSNSSTKLLFSLTVVTEANANDLESIKSLMYYANGNWKNQTKISISDYGYILYNYDETGDPGIISDSFQMTAKYINSLKWTKAGSQFTSLISSSGEDSYSEQKIIDDSEFSTIKSSVETLVDNI